mgnify:FL=1
MKHSYVFCIHILDVGQGINVGPGKFGKKLELRALCNYLRTFAQKWIFPSLIEAVARAMKKSKVYKRRA